MTQSLSPSRAAHACVSIGALVLALILAAGLIAGFATQYGVRLSALKARADSAGALAVRLEELRADIKERLDAIGVAPRDFEAVASAETARELVSAACAALQSVRANCAVDETPLTTTLALHQARIRANGPARQIVSAIASAATPPLRIANLTIKPGGDEESVDVSALIEVVGARSGEPAS